jgi:hypothetical protein
MLTSDLIAAVEAVQKRFDRFLMIARRWNVELADDWDFKSPSWEAKLRAYVREHGALEPSYGGVDLFVYRRGLWKHLPPFAIGRTRWDSALIYEARKLLPVSNYQGQLRLPKPASHDPQDTPGVFKGPEALRNQSLLGGDEFIFTSLNATHVLTESGIRQNRVWFPPYLLRQLATLPALHPRLRPLAPVVRFSALVEELRPRKKNGGAGRAYPTVRQQRRPVRKLMMLYPNFYQTWDVISCLVRKSRCATVEQFSAFSGP